MCYTSTYMEQYKTMPQAVGPIQYNNLINICHLIYGNWWSLFYFFFPFIRDLVTLFLHPFASKIIILFLCSFYYVIISNNLHVWFEHAWQEELRPMVQLQNLTLSFSSESSIQEELKRESTADVITIVVSIFCAMPIWFFSLKLYSLQPFWSVKFYLVNLFITCWIWNR